ncbi:Fc fragment of IgE, low affinity II, receptor for (CD23) [Chamberlinius hualienensis]
MNLKLTLALIIRNASFGDISLISDGDHIELLTNGNSRSWLHMALIFSKDDQNKDEKLTLNAPKYDGSNTSKEHDSALKKPPNTITTKKTNSGTTKGAHSSTSKKLDCNKTINPVSKTTEKSVSAVTSPVATTSKCNRSKKVKKCRADFFLIGDLCYQFNQILKTWRQAANDCRNKNAQMAHPMNFKENQRLVKHMRAHFCEIGRWWLGATDEKKERQWKWEHDNSSVTYYNWSEFQPDNKFNNENCLQYWPKKNWKWNDEKCSNLFFYICEEKSKDVEICG